MMPHARTVAFVAALSLSGAALAQAPGDADTSVLLEAARHVAPDGQLLDGARLLIRDGRIASLDGDVPAGVHVQRFPGAVLCPGLIDCLSQLGVQDGASERSQALQPDLNTRDVLNVYASQLAAALAAGVTTFALSPADENLVGGRVAICRTAGPDGLPAVLSEDGPLALSLAPAVFKRDREPTSRSGAVGLLRDALTAAQEAESGALHDLVSGRMSGLLVAPSGADVLTALQFAQEFNLRLALVHTWYARDVAEPLVERGGTVVVGPLGSQAGPRAARAAGLLASAQVRIALAGGLPAAPADSLRWGAAIATRGGLPAARARAAITSVPAEVLGVDAEVGSLQPGLRGDVVVFSGDPLDLRSRVLAVFVDGVCVFRDTLTMEVPWK